MNRCPNIKCENEANPLGVAFPYCSPACRKTVRAQGKKEEVLARAAHKRKTQKPLISFYQTNDWKVLRYEALRRADGKCVLCGLAARHGVTLHVDHIIPRSIDPAKGLDINNLQVTCSGCNIGKGCWDDRDWR